MPRDTNKNSLNPKAAKFKAVMENRVTYLGKEVSLKLFS